MDGAIDVLREFLLQEIKDLPKMRALLRIHVLLPLFRDVGSDGFMQQIQGNTPQKTKAS